MSKNPADSQQPKELPEIFAHYRVLRPLGKGGMGTVYLAQDTRLNRPVALKVCHLSDNSHALARFRREAQAAASLRHPGLCPVYDYDVHDGIPYFTMAVIEGPSLDKWIAKRGGLTPREAAGLTRKLAISLQAAHAKGVIHRDLKPSNVALENGEPVVLDFGLARHSEPNDTESRLTKAGSIMGTPTYMSPEQVEGNIDVMGPATDIYTLGVMLYEFLTGQAPFNGSMAAVLGHIMSSTPKPPSELRPGLDLRLEAICLKAMAKKPEDRWPSMEAFAVALADWGRAASPDAGAAPVRPGDPAARNSTLKTGTPLGQGPTATFDRGTAPMPETLTRDKVSGEASRSSKEAARDTAARASKEVVRETVTRSSKEAARETVARSSKGAVRETTSGERPKADPDARATASDRAANRTQREEAEDEETPARKASPKKKKKRKESSSEGLQHTALIVRYLCGFAAFIIVVVVFIKIMNKRDWSLSGGPASVKEEDDVLEAKSRKIAEKYRAGISPPVGDKQPPVSPTNGLPPTVTPFPMSPVQPPLSPRVGELRSTNEGAAVVGVAFKDDGSAYLAANTNGISSNLSDGNALQGLQPRIIIPVGVLAMQLNPKNNEALLLTQDGLVASVQTGGTLLPGKTGFVGAQPRALAVAEDGVWVAVGTVLGCMDLSNPINGGNQFNAPGVACIAGVPKVRRIATGSDQGDIQVWDTAARKSHQTFTKMHTGRVNAVAVSSDGKRLVSAGQDKSVRIWDMQTGKELRRCDGHTASVTCVALFREGPFALTGSEDGTVRLWNTDDGKELWKFEGHKGTINSVAVAPNGRRGASGGADQTSRLFAWPEDLVKANPAKP